MRMFVRMFVLIFALLALTAPISLAADEQKGLFHEILDKIMIFFENTFPQETRITNFPQEITIYPQATDNAQDENTPSESAGIQSTSKKNDFSISYSEKLGKKGNSIYVKRKKYSGNEKSSFETALDSITDASAETESAPLNTEKDFETENEILENTYTCPVLASPLCEEGTTPEPVIDQGCITGYQCIQTCPDIYITEPICKNGNIEKVYNKDGCLTALNCKTENSCPSQGGFCGGIAGIQCCNGYKCQLDGNYPDAGGTCMPEIKIPEPQSCASENQLCGGIMGTQCCTGTCKISGNFPQPSGICTSEADETNTCPDIYITEPICKNGNIEKVYNKDGCLTALNCKTENSCPSQGGFCGGIAGIQCCNGYKCQLDGNYPDAGGTCMPEPGTGYLKGALKIGPICPVEIASDNFAYNTYSHEINEKGKICTQVITNARNPYNGECKEFPTPCDVPEGWVKVSSCENQCTPPPEIFMNRKIIIYRDNTKVNELELDKNLEYSTLLEPGNFIVDVTDSNGNILPLYLPRQIGEAEPIEAEVKEGETTIINFDIDTGIR